ncbi:MAG TPA: hypothetical protein VFZ01_05195 [Geminicoccaceae bacterium]
MGALVVGLIGAEVVLRLEPHLLPETAQLRLHWRDTADAVPKVADPELGFTHPPHQSGEVTSGDLTFSFTTNEEGFRSKEPWPAQADVVVIGDSQTFGFGVDDDEHWVALLDGTMGDAKVVNLGINGTGPTQHHLLLEAYKDELEPETVVLGLFPGQALGAAAEFEAWVEAGRPETFLDHREQDDTSPLWKRAIYWAMERSHLVLLARSVADGLRTPYPGSTLEIDGGRVSFTPYVWAGHADAGEPGDHRFELVMEGVERVQATAAREGMGFLVVLFPTKEEVYLPMLGKPVPNLTPPFADALKARGIPFIDLLPHFRARAAGGERLFLEIDIHPNARGYALVADAVRQRLEEDASRMAKMESARESRIRRN